MQRKTGLRERLGSLLELPGDALLDVARVTLVGDMELVIENHRGLCEYTPNLVVFFVPEGQLAVEGTELTIAAISPEQVILLGKIGGLRYRAPDGGAK